MFKTIVRTSAVVLALAGTALGATQASAYWAGSPSYYSGYNGPHWGHGYGWGGSWFRHGAYGGGYGGCSVRRFVDGYGDIVIRKVCD